MQQSTTAQVRQELNIRLIMAERYRSLMAMGYIGRPELSAGRILVADMAISDMRVQLENLPQA